jgi:hypothetical protein
LKVYILSDVGKGLLKRWSPVDPRFADVDEMEPPDWKAFRRELAAIGRNGVLRIVRPEYEGSRAQARREMGIHDSVYRDNA